MEDANFTAWDERFSKIEEQRLFRIRSNSMAVSEVMTMIM